MARETLPEALRLMFGDEGGYSNHPDDPGGPTKYGITARTLGSSRKLGRAATAAEVKALTVEEAETIYRKSYWSQSGGDLLPRGLDYAAFDFGVNSGPATAVKKLQEVIGVTQDGIVGVQTVAAVERYPGGIEKLIPAYCDERMAYLRGLRTWSKFGRGWTIRVTGKDPKGEYASRPGVVGNALRMAASAAPLNPASEPKFVTEGGKAPPADKSITDIIKNPEAWGPLGGLLSAMGSLFAGTGPVQWALAAGIIVGVGIGVYAFIQRQRREA
ncbi:lysozyme family protein [Mesorhizobium sp. J18]|uniref:glycoside hydrolase family 108 protein n=1 Tax=Mesorhizobium sp. J18 TaxID=935263 RepID=UPI0011990AD3|nr:glycoside hydrolase family 108 protein [Mesorhizobium sp. J18]TWG90304.1 lysozyme family protein [Mesorhizobium sp. J18]